MPAMSQAATSREFGPLPDGTTVRALTIGTAPGPVVEVLTLGATVHRLEVGCGDGTRRNVALGHLDSEERLASGDYVGGTIGRYVNRIAGGRFELEGREVTVGVHDRGNSLNGGPDGFDRRGWDVGTGPMESMCGVTTDRIKGRGRRWDIDNAESLMALEALRQSNLWDKHWANALARLN